MTGAMMKGALADCATRFPTVAKLVFTVFSGRINRLILDTKVNEEYSVQLVERRVSRAPSCVIVD